MNLTIQTQSFCLDISQQPFKRWDENLSKNELGLTEEILYDCMNYFSYELTEN